MTAGTLSEQMDRDNGLCVCLAPTGMMPTKATNPYVPIEPVEIVDEVLAAAELGITYVHLHARDSTGQPTQSPDIYAEIVDGIRRFNTELVICLSLSGRLVADPAMRALPLQLDGALKPDMGSLTLSSLNFVTQASVNAPGTIEYLAKDMLAKGIKPELEVFDLGMVNYAKVLIRRGLITSPCYFNVLLGSIASAQMSALELGTITSVLPPDSMWSLAGIGDAQLRATAVAIAMGAGVRIGLEDCLWFDRKRSKPATNLALLKRTLQLLELHDRAPMPPAAFRKAMGLAPGAGRYGLANLSVDLS